MSTLRKPPPITIENAKLMFRNFGGRKRLYNDEGDRNFNVVLTEDLADILAKDGWNVKVKPPRQDGDDTLYLLKVAVRFDPYPPRVIMITKSGGRVNLNEDNIDILDDAELETIDLVITASRWERKGETGVKAYLKKAFATLSPQDLESKYSDSMAPARRVVDEDDD